MTKKKTREALRKDGLITVISECASISKAESERALGFVLNGILQALNKGYNVTLMGFGSFEVQRREARDGRNPQTGKEIHIPAYYQPVFKAGQKMKDSVNKEE